MNFKKYNFLLVAAFILGSLQLSAQKKVIPGYQGKRLMVGLNFNSMLALNYTNAKGKTVTGEMDRLGDDAQSYLAFSGRWDLNANYVLSRKMTGTFSMGYGKTGLLANAEFSRNNSERTFQSQSFLNYGYNFASIGVQYQRKKRWGIAPLGPFWGVRYVVARANKPKLKKIEISNDYLLTDGEDCDCTLMHIYDDATSEYSDYQQLFHTFQIMVGSRNIIKDRFYLESAVTLSPLHLYKGLQQYQSVKARFQSLFVGNIRVGVGILL